MHSSLIYSRVHRMLFRELWIVAKNRFPKTFSKKSNCKAESKFCLTYPTYPGVEGPARTLPVLRQLLCSYLIYDYQYLPLGLSYWQKLSLFLASFRFMMLQTLHPSCYVMHLSSQQIFSCRIFFCLEAQTNLLTELSVLTRCPMFLDEQTFITPNSISNTI